MMIIRMCFLAHGLCLSYLGGKSRWCQHGLGLALPTSIRAWPVAISPIVRFFEGSNWLKIRSRQVNGFGSLFWICDLNGFSSGSTLVRIVNPRPDTLPQVSLKISFSPLIILYLDPDPPYIWFWFRVRFHLLLNCSGFGSTMDPDQS